MYLPSLPEIRRIFSAPGSKIQLTLSVFLVGFALGQIAYGPLSDKYGRRPVLLGALSIFLGATAACSLAYSADSLIAARFFQALGGSGAIVLARAIIRDLYEGARAGRELSLVAATMALAPIVAPVVGGILQTAFGWRASFILLALFAAGAILVVWRWLPETLRHPSSEPLSPASVLRTFGSFLPHPSFCAHLLIVTFSYMGLFAWISGVSFLLSDVYNLSALEIGVAFALTCFGYLAGALLAARIVTRVGLHKTLGFGCAALALGGLGMLGVVALVPTSALALLAPVTLYLAGLGLALPQGVAGALTPFRNNAGAASSLLGFVQQTCAAALGILVGQMLGESAWPVVIPIALMGCLSWVAWRLTKNARREQRVV
jgi:DHA1 family bicyclomycin/chloramphenicol resistance-like MFS transporter